MNRRVSWIALAVIIGLFLAYKLFTLDLRFGDGNAYFAMADGILRGQLPYRDFFTADPPVLVSFLTVVKSITGQNLYALQSLPIWLEALNAILIFLILQRLKSSLAVVGSLIYLFSFTVLATTDYLTGVQLAITFSLISIYALLVENFLLAGSMLALAALTKMYSASVIIGVISVLAYQRQFKSLAKLAIGGGATALVVLSPFLLLAPVRLWQALIGIHFNRPGGIDHTATFGLFFSQEWILLLLASVGLYFHRQKWVMTYLISSALFFLFYPDLYYTYLDYLLPYLCIATTLILTGLWSKYPKWGMAVAALLLFYFYTSLTSYATGVQPDGRFTNSDQIAAYLNSLPAQPLYGSHEVTPLIALQTNRPIFANIYDSNPQLFAAGAYDLNNVSQSAAKQGVYLLARITDRPDLGVTDYGYQGYFSEEIFKKSCHRLKDFPSSSGQADNLIAVYDCHD